MARSHVALASTILMMAAMPIGAAPQESTHSASLDALKACRGQNEATARLSCYDAAVAKLLDAEAKRDVVVIDRDQVRAARRSLFGLSLPNFKMFGESGGGKDKTAGAEEFDRLDTTLVNAQQDNYGRWVFNLAEGQRWHQIDDNEIPRKMHPGDKVVVQRAALGSFKLSVGNNLAVRVHREN